MENFNDYQEVRECVYKGEKYSVRDDGMVYRHPKEGGRKRNIDETWTYGKQNPQNGYMYVSSHRVHIIVATAFHGSNDSTKMVVDHIDNNKCNNRATNLRWLSRLENAIINEITLEKIKYLYGGDIDRFLSNPSSIRELANASPSHSWMRTVSETEAENCLINLRAYVSKRNTSAGNHEKKEESPSEKSMERFYDTPSRSAYMIQPQSEFKKAIFPSNAIQKNWPAPSEFPCCPETISGDPMDCYMKQISDGVLLVRTKRTETYVMNSSLLPDKQGAVFCCKCVNCAKDYSVWKVTYVQGQYIHEIIGGYFTQEGAQKYYTIATGEEWTGGDVFDDFC